MYEDNVIKQLTTCLKEVIVTALRRFKAMQISDIKHYTTSNGSSISFVSCPYDRFQKLEDFKMMINDLQQFSQTELQVIDDRTNAAIKESLVQHMVAKL